MSGAKIIIITNLLNKKLLTKMKNFTHQATSVGNLCGHVLCEVLNRHCLDAFVRLDSYISRQIDNLGRKVAEDKKLRTEWLLLYSLRH